MALPKQIRGYAQIVDLSIRNAQIDNATIELGKLVEGAELIKRDGSVPFTGNVDAGSNKIVSVANGTAANDAVNKSQLDAEVSTLTTATSDNAAAISAETTRAQAAEAQNAADIVAEAGARTSEDTAINTRIDNLEQTVATGSSIRGSFQSVSDLDTLTEADLVVGWMYGIKDTNDVYVYADGLSEYDYVPADGNGENAGAWVGGFIQFVNVADVTGLVATEQARAEGEEARIEGLVTAEVTRATAAEGVIAADLASEISRATAAEAANATAISALDSDKYDKTGGTISGNATVTGDFETQGSATFNGGTFNGDASFNGTLVTFDTLFAGTGIETDLSSSAAADKLASAAAIKNYVDNSAQSQNEASEISFDNLASGLTATDVQAAIDELDSTIDNLASTGGSNGVSVDNEVPTGNIDGLNTAFETAETPLANSEHVYYNGSRLRKTTDYGIAGKTITLTFAPETGDSVVVDYRK